MTQYIDCHMGIGQTKSLGLSPCGSQWRCFGVKVRAPCFFSMFFLPLNDLLVILYIAMENHHFEWLSINHLQCTAKKNIEQSEQ